MTNAAITIGMNARLFPVNWRPARDEIAFAAAAGFGCLQFHGQEQGSDAAYFGAEPRAVGATLRSAGIEAVMEIVLRVRADGRTRAGLTPTDVLRANLAAIEGLGIERVHWHLAPAEWMTAAQLRALEREAAAELAAGVELAASHGFRLSLEHNEPDIPLFATATACAEALDAVPGLGFVWDLNHTEPALLDAFLAFAPRMTLLHVSDTPLPEVNHHLPLGLGSIDFGAYLASVVARGYRGPAVLEIGGIPKSGGFGRDTDAALVDSLARLRRVV